MWIKRDFSDKIRELAKQRPAILITGARQTGKTSLLKKLFPQAEYVNFDVPSTAERAESNPQNFLLSFSGQVILDEVQYVPGLFRYIKEQIDKKREINGKWLLTGSQKFSLMKSISESLAGRISILELETLSLKEISEAKLSQKKYLIRGGYPELWQKSILDRNQFFDDYIATYLQRDLRQILEVDNIRSFERFLRSLALRSSNLINFTDAAKDAGVTGVTGKKWFEVLYTSNLCGVLEPYFNNQLKRLVKSPKVFFKDTGLLCYLLNVSSMDDFLNSTHRGPIFENFIYREIISFQKICLKPFNLFFLRNKNNLEVDFLIETATSIYLIESKSSERVSESDLNFEKVEIMFGSKRTIKKVVACLHNEKKSYSKNEIHYVNPLSNPDWLVELKIN